LLIKYIKSVLWRVAKRLSYIEEARCLKVKSSEGCENMIPVVLSMTPCTLAGKTRHQIPLKYWYLSTKLHNIMPPQTKLY